MPAPPRNARAPLPGRHFVAVVAAAEVEIDEGVRPVDDRIVTVAEIEFLDVGVVGDGEVRDGAGGDADVVFPVGGSRCPLRDLRLAVVADLAEDVVGIEEDQIVAEPAMQLVDAAPAPQRVIAVEAFDQVGGKRADEAVVCRAALDVRHDPAIGLRRLNSNFAAEYAMTHKVR